MSDGRQNGGGMAWGVIALIALIAVGVRLPALEAGFRTDDYVQLAMLEGRFAIERAPWDLYWFGGRDAAETRALIASGYLPWWTDDGHRVAMLRPLSSLLLALDHGLFGRAPPGYHLHSLLWLVALIASAGVLLSRLLPTGLAALALLLYAIDEAHTVPASWIANRSTLVATTLGMLALLSHVRAREAGERGGVRAALLWAACLASGEYGLCMVGYLLAYELLGRREALALRLRALAPAALLACAYVALRAGLGYGPRASGYYLSPFDQPLELMTRGAGRLAALIGELALGVPAPTWHQGPPLRGTLISLRLVEPETWQRLPSWQLVQGVLGILGLLALVLGRRWLGRRLDDGARTQLWLLAGALGSLLIAASSLPDSRLLTAAALGVAALLAALLGASWRALASATGKQRAAAWLGLGALVLLHVLLPLRRDWLEAASMASGAAAERAQARDGALDGRGPALLVTASDFATAAHLPLIRAAEDRPSLTLLRLSGAPRAHDLRRVGPRTLELSVLSHGLRDFFAGSLYRPRAAAFRPGQRIECPGMAITVLQTRDGNPARLRVELDRPLDELPLLHVSATGLQRIELPASGETVRLPAAAPATLVRR